MAQAVGDAVGATKRQIQLWSDAGVLECLAGTDRQGRGRQRLYHVDELRFAALARAVSVYQIPISILKRLTDKVRKFGGASQWWMGEVDSYLVFVLKPTASVTIVVPGALANLVRQTDGAVVINMRRVLESIRS